MYEGWLLKLATSFSAYVTLNGWRRRWCVLHQDKLEWYSGEGQLREPRGVIAFGPDCHCEHAGVIRNRYYSFRIVVQGGDSVSFAAETYELAARWVEVINAKIRRASLVSRGNKSIASTGSFIVDMEVGGGKGSASGDAGKEGGNKVAVSSASSLRNATRRALIEAGSVRSVITSLLTFGGEPRNDGGDTDDEEEGEDTNDDDEGDDGLVSEESFFVRRKQSGIPEKANRNEPVGGSDPKRQSGFPLRKARSLHGDFILPSSSSSTPLSPNALDDQAIEWIKECSRRATYRSLVQNGEWELVGLRDGTRVFYQPDPLCRPGFPIVLKVQATVSSSPSKIFEAMMDLSETRKKWDQTFLGGLVFQEDPVEASSTAFETINWAVHWPFSSVLVVGEVQPRSFVLARHWRHDSSSGSYIIMYRPQNEKKDGSDHYLNAIPASVLFGAVYITPNSNELLGEDDEERTNEIGLSSTVTFALQVDLKGWLGASSPFAWISGQSAERVCDILTTVSKLNQHFDSLSVEETESLAAMAKKRRKEAAKLKAATARAERPVQGPQVAPAKPAAPPLPSAEQLGQPVSIPAAMPAPEKPVVLDYSYDIPLDSTAIPPREFSKDGKNCYWDSGSDCDFYNIRGPNYLVDRVKIHTKPSAMEIVAMQLAMRTEPISHISAHPDHLIQRQHAGRSDRPFLIVLNFIVPTLGNWTTYFARRRGMEEDPVFERMLQHFIEGDDDYRNSRFKIIPGIVEGPWVVKRGVGNKPAILGTKIKCNYYPGDNCFEIEVDVSTSKIAASCLSLVRAYTQYVTIDLAFLFESQSFDELPERLLGAVRACSPNLG